MYNKFNISDNDGTITSGICNLYFNSDKSITVFIPYKVLQVFKNNPLQEGMRVKVTGNLNIYAINRNAEDPDNALSSPVIQIYCTFLEVLPDQNNYNFHVNNNPKPFPDKLPKIALITRVKSEGYGDFLKEIGPALRKNIIPYNVKLTGIDGIHEIEKAITNINISNSADIICIVRGGGDRKTIDTVFNSYPIYNAIWTSAIPVFVGIGHSSNITYADYASDSPINADGAKTFYTSPSLLAQTLKTYYSNYEPVKKAFTEKRIEKMQTEPKADYTKLLLLVIFVLLFYIIFFK